MMKALMEGRTRVVAQPLYAQVRERLLERIVGKEWQEGQVLPNEFDLARQFGVSIGTIRKAVEGLEAARIVVRKQGRGTFVSRESAVPQTEPVCMSGDAGIDHASVVTTTLSHEHRPATGDEADGLMLSTDRSVISIVRRRTFAGGARVLDRIALPQHMFFDLEPQDRLPDNLYEYFGDYFGIRAVKCRETVSSVTGPSEALGALDLPAGAPMIRIERTSLSSTGEVIEWRESHCWLPKGISSSGLC